ncbi:hypothetical protein Tco_0090233 [Tanacetum coccineum]
MFKATGRNNNQRLFCSGEMVLPENGAEHSISWENANEGDQERSSVIIVMELDILQGTVLSKAVQNSDYFSRTIWQTPLIRCDKSTVQGLSS